MTRGARALIEVASSKNQKRLRIVTVTMLFELQIEPFELDIMTRMLRDMVSGAINLTRDDGVMVTLHFNEGGDGIGLAFEGSETVLWFDIDPPRAVAELAKGSGDGPS